MLSLINPIPNNINKGIIGKRYLVNLTSKLPVISRYGMTQDKITKYFACNFDLNSMDTHNDPRDRNIDNNMLITLLYVINKYIEMMLDRIRNIVIFLELIPLFQNQNTPIADNIVSGHPIPHFPN